MHVKKVPKATCERAKNVISTAHADTHAHI